MPRWRSETLPLMLPVERECWRSAELTLTRAIVSVLKPSPSTGSRRNLLFRRFCGRRDFLRRCAPRGGRQPAIHPRRAALGRYPGGSSRCVGPGSIAWSGLFLGGDAGRGERGGLLEACLRRKTLEHLDEVGFGSSPCARQFANKV
jgi:hypothetical protein